MKDSTAGNCSYCAGLFDCITGGIQKTERSEGSTFWRDILVIYLLCICFDMRDELVLNRPYKHAAKPSTCTCI